MVLGQWLSYPAAGDRILSIVGIETHWAILQYVLGLPFMTFIALLLYNRTGDEKWKRFARTLAKGFVIVFAVGAATGTASEFGLVLLWPNLLEAAGRYIYFPLYAEIFAFLMEVVFIYMLFYAWDKVSSKTLVFIAFLAFLGAWYSASMIVSVNSYMVAPTGIHTAYDPYSGWKYTEGYPKIDLYVPKNIAGVLNATTLKALGAEFKDDTGDSIVIAFPSAIVQRLVYESWNNILVKDSILTAVVLPDKATSSLLNTPVKDLVDEILVNTIKHIGVYTVTFKSPVYPGSILHALGAALTVSGFTVMAAYALRMLKGSVQGEYREYVENAFKFAAIFTLVVIVIQGAVFGHLMGEEVAHANPEKLAAMEGTTDKYFSLSKLVGSDKIMPLIIYGDTRAKLPSYDGIPDDYCQLSIAPNEAIETCKPPILIHYLYYTKFGLSLLLGLYAAIVGYYVYRKQEIPVLWLKLATAAPLVAHLVSFLGWGVREIGRKPWTIYGVMTVDVAHTVNPPSTWEIAEVSLFFIAVIGLLVYTVWRLLWRPGGVEV